MNDNSANPPAPGPAKGFLRQYGAYMIGGAVVVGLIAAPLEIAIKNNRAEYEATGDFGALFGHPFDGGAHGAFKSPHYAELIAKNPDLRLSPDDTPEMRAMKITAINAQAKAILQAKIDASTIVQRKVITGPAEGQATVLQGQYDGEAIDRAYQTQNEASNAMQIGLNKTSYNSEAPFRIYIVDTDYGITMKYGVPLAQNWASSTPDKPPSYLSVQDNSVIANVLTSPATSLPAGSKTITPFIYMRGTGAAWTTTPKGQKVVPVELADGNGDTKYGFIDARDYEALGGPPLGPIYTGKGQ